MGWPLPKPITWSGLDGDETNGKTWGKKKIVVLGVMNHDQCLALHRHEDIGGGQEGFSPTLGGIWFLFSPWNLRQISIINTRGWQAGLHKSPFLVICRIYKRGKGVFFFFFTYPWKRWTHRLKSFYSFYGLWARPDPCLVQGRATLRWFCPQV